jgi:hypothetical protein
MMRFTTIQCGGPASNMNWRIILTANTRSLIVPTIAYTRDPTALVWNTLHFPLHVLKFLVRNFNNFVSASNIILTGLYFAYWNAWGSPRCSSFGSWWWKGLFYSSQISLLGNNATFQDRLSQIPSWAPTRATLTCLYCLPIWSNCSHRGLSPTNTHLFVWYIIDDSLDSYKGICWWRMSQYGSSTPLVISLEPTQDVHSPFGRISPVDSCRSSPPTLHSKMLILCPFGGYPKSWSLLLQDCI